MIAFSNSSKCHFTYQFLIIDRVLMSALVSECHWSQATAQTRGITSEYEAVAYIRRTWFDNAYQYTEMYSDIAIIICHYPLWKTIMMHFSHSLYFSSQCLMRIHAFFNRVTLQWNFTVSIQTYVYSAFRKLNVLSWHQCFIHITTPSPYVATGVISAGQQVHWDLTMLMNDCWMDRTICQVHGKHDW